MFMNETKSLNERHFFKYAIKARIYSIKKVIQVIKNCQTNSFFFINLNFVIGIMVLDSCIL